VKGFQQVRTDSGMALYGDICIRVPVLRLKQETGGECEKADVVKQRRKFEMMEIIRWQPNRSPQGHSQGRRPMAMTLLPGESMVEFLGGLADQNAFNISSRP